MIGEIADGVNAGLYALEGDLENAGISLLGVIPIVGDLGKLGRTGKRIYDFASNALRSDRVYERGGAKVLRLSRPGGFRGPKANCFDWDHILDSHSPRGLRAQDYVSGTKFPANMTDDQIKAAVQQAWKNRENFQTLENTVWYRGTDSVSGLIIEFIFNKVKKTVDTAYPIDPTKRLKRR